MKQGTERTRTIIKLARLLCFLLSVFVITAFVILLCCEHHWQDECIGLGVDNAAAANEQSEAEPKRDRTVLDKYRDIYEQYPDVVGYLFIPDTGVRYYVFQGTDNEYYLHHGRDGNKTSSGEIYLDCRCDIGDLNRHLIIYGHNMRNNTMFGSLECYKDADFFCDHPIITFNTIYGDFKWEVFSVRIANVDEAGNEIIRTQFDDESEWYEYTLRCQSESIHEIPVAINKNDVVLTLVTCSYEYDNGRLLVQARLVK